MAPLLSPDQHLSIQKILITAIYGSSGVGKSAVANILMEKDLRVDKSNAILFPSPPSTTTSTEVSDGISSCT